MFLNTHINTVHIIYSIYIQYSTHCHLVLLNIKTCITLHGKVIKKLTILSALKTTSISQFIITVHAQHKNIQWIFS